MHISAISTYIPVIETPACDFYICAWWQIKGREGVTSLWFLFTGWILNADGFKHDG